MSGRHPIRAALVLALVVAVQLALAAPALATPPPKRPHPHRKPWPITLTVQVVPAIAGVRVRLDDRTSVSDAQGTVRFTEEHNFSPHTLRLMDTSVHERDRRLRFVRWAGQRDPDQAFRSTVTGLPMRMNYTVTAAFAVQRPVTTTLLTTRSRAVDPARVTSVTLRSGRQGLITVPPSGRLWLDTYVPVYRNSGIALEKETYSLTAVIVGGTNTVDAGRQRFAPADNRSPVFRTKFFDLTVTSHDLLFKGPTGDAARITYPDGSVHTLPFAANGSVTTTDLPRGTYQITAVGGGTALPSQLVLSRNSTVDLPIATHRDYAALGLALMAIMVGLLLIGRGRRRLLSMGRRLLAGRRSRATGPIEEPTTEPDRRFEKV